MSPIFKTIQSLKSPNFSDAQLLSIPILDDKQNLCGHLVPVGEWALKDDSIATSISEWRSKTMRMFLTQFKSTPERSRHYLETSAVNTPDRLLFMIYDSDKNLVGHIGLMNITDLSVEIDNLMRGSAGGHPRLIYFAEWTLLNYCFKTLQIEFSTVKVISYNWLVFDLHESIGYTRDTKYYLNKRVVDDFTFHDYVDETSSNVNFHVINMTVRKETFLKKA